MEMNTRRQFLKKGAVATAALSSLAYLQQNAHAAGSDELKVGLIGCGGRGTGAVVDALTADPQARLVAMGDVFADYAASSLETLRSNTDISARIDVTPDNIFTGFDAYKHVIDSDIDVVILASSPHFRPEHLKYAIGKGKHCFVEKPIAVDVPGVKSVMETCVEAREKGLSVVSGLCWRYDIGAQETIKRIQDGAIGEIIAIESLYNTGLLWHRGDDPQWSRMEYQMRNWLYYTWLSGDHLVEQVVHNLDRCAWILGDVNPIRALGYGGRQQRVEKKFGHIFDHHIIFYEFPNGVKVHVGCRQQANCPTVMEDVVIGTKGKANILKHQILGETKWRFHDKKPGMYLAEQQAMFAGIRSGNPINNGDYMCNSNMIGIMGRMCTYSGQTLTWDQAFSSELRLGPSEYAWTDMPEPPVAVPGVTEAV